MLFTLPDRYPLVEAPSADQIAGLIRPKTSAAVITQGISGSYRDNEHFIYRIASTSDEHKFCSLRIYTCLILHYRQNRPEFCQ